MHGREVAMKGLMLAVLLLLAGIRVMSHHGWNDVDRNNPTTLTGKIKTLHYMNPHVAIELDGAGKGWNIELLHPSGLDQRGVTREMLLPGTKINLTGFPYKGVSGRMRAEKITLNGKTFSMLPPSWK
jgi:hypothetical protein